MSTTYLDTLSESPLILVIYLQTSLDMSGFSPWHQYWSMAELYQTVIIPFNLSMTESNIEEENQFLSTFFPIFIHEINYWKLWNNTLIIQIKNIFIKTSSQVFERRNMTYTFNMYNTKWRKRNITTTKK